MKLIGKLKYGSVLLKANMWSFNILRTLYAQVMSSLLLLLLQLLSGVGWRLHFSCEGGGLGREGS